MIPRIASLTPLPGYRLDAWFDDGRHVVYDMAEDIRTLPGYGLLAQVPRLFEQVQLDSSRTVVYWNEEIDLPSHALYEAPEA